jgi:hypothetical protein
MIGKTTLHTDGRNKVSHQCELSYEFSDWQMILCICYNESISWFSLLSNFVARCWNLLQTLFSVWHQLLLLVCLEFEEFPSAPPVFHHNQSQVHLEHLLLPQKAEAVSLLLPPFQSCLHHI